MKTATNTSYLDTNLRAFIPFFTYGVLFSDIENLRDSVPLDALRDLEWWQGKILINIVFAALLVIYGSMTLPATCEVYPEDTCQFQDAVTFNTGKYGYWFFQTIGALAGFLFALTSPAFMCVLRSWPFWFLGKVSYTLYLFHLLVVKWPCLEL